MRSTGFLLSLVFVAVLASPRARLFALENDAVGEWSTVLSEHCHRCHRGNSPKGKVDLGRLSLPADLLREPELLKKVIGALEAGEMPPPKAKQLAPETRGRILAELKALLASSVDETSELAPVVLRRLNRYEYNNAVRDLLDLRGDLYPLPEKCIRAGEPYFDPASGRFPDEMRVGNRPLGKFQVERQILEGVVPFAIDLQSEHGFNNRGDELGFSPILFEAFLKLGRSIVESQRFESYCRAYSKTFAAPDLVVPNAKIGEAALVAAARARIADLLFRAFRGPVDDATVERYVTFFGRELQASGDFPGAMRRVVSAVLASPRFIYLVEEKNAKTPGTFPLSEFELATRLSFFLWSSIPDSKLLESARVSRLKRDEELESQVRRMLREKRSKALADNFARQWLRLDQLITAAPDMRRFPTYYSRIGCEHWKFGLQMMVEPLLLFESVLVEDRSILLLVDSDFSYRSDELETWYRSSDPFGKRGSRNRFNTNQQTFKRRRLHSRREGGVITTAAVLTMTSSPLRTSPIVRGAWVATVIFNRPPPPPPDDVPEIEADDAVIEASGLTLRDRLVQHRDNAACASCHSKIDPLGYALENFDAVGRWRDRYRSGLPVDASGKLFGNAEFRDVVELKDAILAEPRRFVEAFTEHMLSYALGRELKVSDRPAVTTIVERVLADGGRMSTLIVEIVKSRPFRHKTVVGVDSERGRTDPGAEEARSPREKSKGKSE